WFPTMCATRSFLLLARPRPRPPTSPYTTLFRSWAACADERRGSLRAFRAAIQHVADPEDLVRPTQAAERPADSAGTDHGEREHRQRSTSGPIAMPHGVAPTRIVATTLSDSVSITDTSFDGPFAVYRNLPSDVRPIPHGRA